MHRIGSGLVIFAALVPLGAGAPVEGPSWSYKLVGAGAAGPGGTITPGTLEFSKLFAAGQRACVIVIGDHDPIVDVEVEVYDSRNKLVARDRGQEPAQDFVAVMWYPPRQETYRIVINSYGKVENKCSVAIR
jgi:hypothetical protein